MPAQASPEDLARLQQSRETNIRNPYRAGRQGQAATLGHMVGAVAPAAGDAILSGTSKVHNMLDSADLAGGKMLNRLGVPESWTSFEEQATLPNNLKPGQSGTVQARRFYTNRASVPLGRAASAATLASLGLWASRKFVDSPHENSMDAQDKTSSSSAILTSEIYANTIDAQKLASHVIEKQANLISELQTALHRETKYAAALAQAVKLAQDGAIDISDVDDHARQLIASGSVKLSAADDMFAHSPGELQGNASSPSTAGQRLDPLTTMLRSLNPR